MSHSQFRRIKTYTETCMDESLRQAYDYWQDQPGSIRRQVPHIRSTYRLLQVAFNLSKLADAETSAS